MPPHAPEPTVALEDSLARVRAGVEAACRRSERRPEEVLLVGVTKTVPVEVIAHARRLGMSDFGENYAAELAGKAEAVPATWHFIGTIQAGTAAKVADHADVIHSLRPGGAVERIARRAASRGRTVRGLVQVDFTGRRHGVPPGEVDGAIASIISLPGIDTAGLMTLPPWTAKPEGGRSYFARLRDLRDRLRGRWPGLVDLSMGMSADYEVAIEEGATMVRVGTALFGGRPDGRVES